MSSIDTAKENLKWFGDLLVDAICRQKRQADYLRRVEEIKRDVERFSGSLFDSTFHTVVGRHTSSGTDEDITERVRALCRFAEISLDMWKALGMDKVMLEYAGEARRLRGTDCKKCGQMPPWHTQHCTQPRSHTRIVSSAAGASDGD